MICAVGVSCVQVEKKNEKEDFEEEQLQYIKASMGKIFLLPEHQSDLLNDRIVLYRCAQYDSRRNVNPTETCISNCSILE